MAKTTIKVNLLNGDSNAFIIIGKVTRALKEGGRKDLVEEFRDEATSGNYNQLLVTVMKYVEVE